ncbi:MAG TPA: hypothetical protein VJH23_02050 [archaeon]|nr:hypothetical protein [archaeon]
MSHVNPPYIINLVISDSKSTSLTFKVNITSFGKANAGFPVTSLEFRSFMESSGALPIVNKIKKEGFVNIGSGTLLKHHALAKPMLLFSYLKFFPLGDLKGDEVFQKSVIGLRGKGIAAIIEARLFKYLKEKYPGARINYGATTSVHDFQLMHRNANLQEFPTLESEYSRLKKYLKEKRQFVNYFASFHKRVQRNKRLHFRKFV